MLFHVKQTHHAPEHCPYGKGGSRSLFDSQSKDVKIHGYWLAFPQHTTYLIVEADDIGKLQKFLSRASTSQRPRSRRSATSPHAAALRLTVHSVARAPRAGDHSGAEDRPVRRGISPTEGQPWRPLRRPEPTPS